MSEKHETTIDALQAVLVAACEHLQATGACNYAESSDSPLCDGDACTYCALARVIDSLPEEMKP